MYLGVRTRVILMFQRRRSIAPHEPFPRCQFVARARVRPAHVPGLFDMARATRGLLAANQLAPLSAATTSLATRLHGQQSRAIAVSATVLDRIHR